MSWYRCTDDDCGVRFKINRKDTKKGARQCPICGNTGPNKIRLVSRKEAIDRNSD